MKAWSVMNEALPCGYIVFAENATDAKIAGKKYEGLNDCEWTDITVHHLPELDGKFNELMVLDWWKHERIYYEAGWFNQEGSLSCDVCGLYEYENIPESKVTERNDGFICHSCIEQEKSESTAAQREGNRMSYETELESPLVCRIVGGVLQIEIGLNRLSGNERHPTIPELKIVIPGLWGEDVVRELQREEEDGSSLLSNCIDKAIQNAMDAGSIGINQAEYEKQMIARKAAR